MTPKDEIENEGHTREWQDRARVVIDAKKAARTEASPMQSPPPGEEHEGVEEKSKSLEQDNPKEDPAY